MANHTPRKKISEIQGIPLDHLKHSTGKSPQRCARHMTRRPNLQTWPDCLVMDRNGCTATVRGSTALGSTTNGEFA